MSEAWFRCEECGADKAERRMVVEELRYRHGSYAVEFEEMVCTECGKDGYLTGEQSKALSVSLTRAAQRRRKRIEEKAKSRSVKLERRAVTGLEGEDYRRMKDALRSIWYVVAEMYYAIFDEEEGDG